MVTLLLNNPLTNLVLRVIEVPLCFYCSAWQKLFILWLPQWLKFPSFFPHLSGPQTSSTYLRLIHELFPPLFPTSTHETFTATGHPVCLLPLMILSCLPPAPYHLAEIESLWCTSCRLSPFSHFCNCFSVCCVIHRYPYDIWLPPVIFSNSANLLISTLSRPRCTCLTSCPM